MKPLVTITDANGFDVKTLDVPYPKFEDQIGFFITNSVPLKLFEITQIGGGTDPFAL